MSNKFPFEEGDNVLVRVRENGTTGRIVAKLEGECVQIYERNGPMSDKARLSVPWGTMNSFTICDYQAEFEVLDE